MTDKVTAWVTTYALTTGIVKVEGEVFAEGSGLSYRAKDARVNSYAHGNDFHLTEDGAKARAEEMRVKKLASLEKQRQKLLKLVF